MQRSVRNAFKVLVRKREGTQNLEDISIDGTVILKCRIQGSSRTGDYEEFYLLGCNAVYSVKNQSTFRKNTIPLSSKSKNKPSETPA
jgi:hypothetical protein